MSMCYPKFDVVFLILSPSSFGDKLSYCTFSFLILLGSSRDPPMSASLTWCTQAHATSQAFYTGAGDVKSGPCACSCPRLACCVLSALRLRWPVGSCSLLLLHLRTGPEHRLATPEAHYEHWLAFPTYSSDTPPPQFYPIN